FGSSRRGVVYDNLVDDEKQPGGVLVGAHGVGHARHGDVPTGPLRGAGRALGPGGGLGVVVPGGGDAARGPRNLALAPGVLALVAVATFLASPLQNGISRRIETRADVDALRTTQDPAAFIRLQHDLATTSLADPTPYRLSQFWFGTHPTALQRVALAQRMAR